MIFLNMILKAQSIEEVTSYPSSNIKTSLRKNFKNEDKAYYKKKSQNVFLIKGNIQNTLKILKTEFLKLSKDLNRYFTKENI